MEQKITWIGHGSWKFVTKAGTVVYVDPYIEGNPACKITMEDTLDADIVCVTHGHDDHIGAGNSIDIALNAKAVFVSIADICAYAEQYGIPYDDGGGALGIGGKVHLKDCTIHCVEALHTSGIWGYEWKKERKMMPGEGCCGFVITPDDGDPVYFAGDTGVFMDMELIGKLYKPLVAVLPVGDKYVMGLEEAACAAEMIRAKYVVPGHHSTWEPIKQDIGELKKLVAVRAPYAEVVDIKPGETFTF